MYPSFEMLCYVVRLGQKSIHIRHVSPPQSKLHPRHKKTQCGRAKKKKTDTCEILWVHTLFSAITETELHFQSKKYSIYKRQQKLYMPVLYIPALGAACLTLQAAHWLEHQDLQLFDVFFVESLASYFLQGLLVTGRRSSEYLPSHHPLTGCSIHMNTTLQG